MSLRTPISALAPPACATGGLEGRLPAADALQRATKLSITLPVDLKAKLDRYATLHGELYGESVDGAALIPHMVEAFMAKDRAFRRA